MAQQVVLATGGAGYIGSHVTAALMAAGYRVVVLDDFSNASEAVIDRLNAIGPGSVEVVRGDVRDRALLDALLSRHAVAAVIHLAGLKAVGESVEKPLRYYDVNVGGAAALLAAMAQAGVRRLVFSSSATVYGEPERVPIRETARLGATSPYGRTKLVIEQMIGDLVAAEPGFAAISLRYFNPVGAHPSGTLGEDPRGVPNNLFPFVAQTAAGLRERVLVFGDDYPTRDGTGIRDYIHVMDLAEGHVAAVDRLMGGDGVGEHRAINLGRGEGFTVLEALAAFRRVVGAEIPFKVVSRRPGDVPELVADPGLAERLLGWRATRDLGAMCADHWTFQKQVFGTVQAR
jgi:UDP-glucose 4-epimerase